MEKNYLLVILILSIQFAGAQNWVRDMHDPRANFFTVQSEFNAWWAIHGHAILSDTAGETEGLWKIYKRWEHDMMPMMVSTNGVRLGAYDAGEANFYRQKQAQQSQRSAPTWSYIGPEASFDDGTGDSCAGRINCVRFDPLNHDIIYCGAPTGGLWKSTDFGQSWQLLNTDNLPQIGVSDIAINPQNPNTIYIATGDVANSACLSIGILKSVDAGQTWDTTGLTFTISQGELIARLLMDPLDSNIMLAATNTGIYKTADGGITWSKKAGMTGLTGMEFNPLNPATIYSWGIQLYKSVDTGNTWHKLSYSLPDTLSSGGFAVGLTPADTACVYVLVSDSATGASYVPYKGLYRSLDAGDTFALQSVNPDNSGTGTQGLYDLNVAVSPVNRDIVVVAAVNSDYSSDGGVTWNAPSQPSHVDHHDLRFFNGSGDTVFSADDGGLFISTDSGDTWHGLNNGMHIGQIYNIASGERTKYLYLSGRQDEGTMRQDTTSERILSGGDGLECLIDPLDENHLFGSVEDGIIGVSSDAGQTVSLIVFDFEGGVNGPGAWNTPYAIQNNNSSILYVAKDRIYKSFKGGANGTWFALNTPTLPTNDNLFQLMAIAPSDSNYIYAATYYHLYRSTDGGDTFTNITDGLGGGIFTSLAVSESNPKEVLVGYDANTPELRRSTNAGSTFQSFATGLPVNGPFYPTAISYVKNSKDAMYVGLANAGGIYYRDSTMTSWAPYSAGLPDVSVDQIEIDYCTNTIRAATYGRDIWESAPYVPLNSVPVANAIYAISESNCTDTISFTDQSDFSPTAWQWYFPGGQPSSSTDENPVVVLPKSGSDTVTFIAINSNGADTTYYAIQTNFCTGVTQLADNNVISVYPNPNNGNFVVSLTGPARGLVNMELTDNLGRTVYQYSYTKDAGIMTTNCALSSLAKGIYYLRITTEGTNTVEKLVIGEQGK